jgi:porphobilinogen deaminase
LKAGTRGSNLAIVQTKNIITQLSKITDEEVKQKYRRYK